ncbi:hypothetical protein GGX14DRAFT_677496 [Mycena pura]|uniref:Uncharacterized protein n=1 Tax=Mycena pura TaxID=153505 RepID=A0AAD6Y0D6_9AGAR|nr:hypothetical protein GGX14DRAFT_677496 [Mycena pura]
MYLRGIKPRNTFEVRGVSEASTWLRITRPHRTPDYRWGTRSPRPLHGPDFPNGFSEPKFRVLSFKIRVFGLVRAFSRHSARHRPAHCNEKKHVLNVSRMNEGGSAQAEQASRTKPASSHFFCRPIQSSGRKTPSDDKSISGPAIASGGQQAAAVAGEAGAKVAGAVADAIASARHASTPRTRRARFVEIVFLHITISVAFPFQVACRVHYGVFWTALDPPTVRISVRLRLRRAIRSGPLERLGAPKGTSSVRTVKRVAHL